VVTGVRDDLKLAFFSCRMCLSAVNDLLVGAANRDLDPRAMKSAVFRCVQALYSRPIKIGPQNESP